MSIVEFVIVESVIVELSTVDPVIVTLSRVESSISDDLMLEHCFTIESSTSEFSVIDDLSDTVVPFVVEELSTV